MIGNLVELRIPFAVAVDVWQSVRFIRVGPEVWSLTGIVMLVAARWRDALVTTDKGFCCMARRASLSSFVRAAAKV